MSPQPKPVSNKRLSQVLIANEIAMVFGVQWMPVTSDVRIGRLLETARQDGYVNYVSHSYQDTVGFIGALPAGVKKAYSAAIILSLQFSEGGTELFVFQQGDLYGLVGLIEYSPMPGFDAIGTKEQIKAVAEEFKLLNASQLMRFHGNVDWFPEHEALELAKLSVKATTTKSDVQLIPNVKRLMALIAASVLVLGGIYGGYSYYEGILEEQQAFVEASLNDPNRLYEAAITSALATTGPPGKARLLQWRALFEKLPLTLNGWVARIVTCEAKQCEVQWMEDPVEYQVEGVSHFSIQRKVTGDEASNPFKGAMMAFLRMDPDVGMFGEIRDQLSAEMALNAIQTGHKILTTVHATSALGVVGRLTSKSLGLLRENVCTPEFISTLVYLFRRSKAYID